MTCFFNRLIVYPAFALSLVVCILISAATLSAAPISGRVIHDEKIINGIANEILNGLDEARMEEFFLISGSDRLSIDIVPFRPLNNENEFMSLALSSELNTFLLSALIQKSKGKFRFHISRREVGHGTTVRLQKNLCGDFSGAPKCGNHGTTSIQNLGSSKANIVILGRLVVHKGMGYLSYKAFAPETGVILAATTPRKINVRFSRTSPLAEEHSKPPSVAPGEYLEPSRWKIFRLQRDLELLGFRPGQINGYLTRQTRQAIRRYQWHHDMDPDGNVTQELLKHIRKAVVLSPWQNRGKDTLGRSGA